VISQLLVDVLAESRYAVKSFLGVFGEILFEDPRMLRDEAQTGCAEVSRSRRAGGKKNARRPFGMS
jgi:hypothetical protein